MSVILNQGLKSYQEAITHEIGSLKTIPLCSFWVSRYLFPDSICYLVFRVL